MSKTVTLYHAPTWCGHCVMFVPHWNDFKKAIKEQGLDIKTVEYTDDIIEKDPKLKAKVSGYPTITINDAEYNGPRTANGLLEACGFENVQVGGGNQEYWKQKYLKYKNKYLKLKQQS